MEKERIEYLRNFYQQYLLENCIPFWIKNGLDHQYGGIWSCLDQKGDVYNTDKSVWFQGRGTWMFSRLYNLMGQKAEWLNAAKLGYDFLINHCFDLDGRMFFSVTRDGKPLQKRRYMFSETFAIIACAEYSKASGDKAALDRARQIYEMVLDLYRNPGKIQPKINPQTRMTKALAMPMILLNTTQSLREIDPDLKYDGLAKEFVDEILKDFFKPSAGAAFEIVGPKGERLDSPQGRCINPGHSIEASWFIMHEGIYRKDQQLIDQALQLLDCSLKIGWDDLYGGLLSFVDIEGKPTEQLEADMKLWWPHTEALHALLLAHHLTGNTKYEEWYNKVHVWSFGHFADQKNPEWFGYLHRDGSVSKTLKGSMWKGPFHLPRVLLLNTKLLETMGK
ncbi:MAG TPA: N-acylglucosamine 2-epimerase [Firmicutes bacterium]|jgi:N-acylglucosamine 2-epimerase|nr:N-acylglucosamine 2-epimerase [Bacillota bacterium]